MTSLQAEGESGMGPHREKSPTASCFLLHSQRPTIIKYSSFSQTDSLMSSHFFPAQQVSLGFGNGQDPSGCPGLPEPCPVPLTTRHGKGSGGRPCPQKARGQSLRTDVSEKTLMVPGTPSGLCYGLLVTTYSRRVGVYLEGTPHLAPPKRTPFFLAGPATTGSEAEQVKAIHGSSLGLYIIGPWKGSRWPSSGQ